MGIAVKLRTKDEIWERYISVLREAEETLLLYDNELENSYSQVDILITTHITEKELEYFPSLEKIYLFKTGTDALPIEKMKERGIKIIPSHANADIIAEHGLALALALMHRIVEFHEDLSEGIWYANQTDYKWRSIRDVAVGIMGFGHIGNALYQKLLPLNNNITVWNQSLAYPEGVRGVSSLESLIEAGDLIFICLPKTEKTINLIDQKILKKMTGKYIVNISRAEICNQQDLYAALRDCLIAGYASDVWYCNPDKKNKNAHVLPAKIPFWKLKNVVMSPHCATHEQYAHERYISDAVETCLKDLKEKNDSF